MKKLRILPSLSLLAVLLAACAPATSTAVPAWSVTVQPTETLPTPVPTLDLTAQATTVPTETLVPTPTVDVQPVATSRGPNLEATDPSTVSLASGGLQLVEFFRFT